MGGPVPFPCGGVGQRPCPPTTASPINRTDSRGKLTESGARWEEILRQTIEIAKMQYLKEYPDHTFED